MNREKDGEAVLADGRQAFGKGAITRLGDTVPSPALESIPTGFVALDLALGTGGIPLGRVTEISGPEAAGKSTLVYHIIAQTQEAGGMAAYIDAEDALDPTHAVKCGVRVEDLLISQPDSGEEALEIAEAVVRSGAVQIVVVDSVETLVPRLELEQRVGESSRTEAKDRLMAKALRRLTVAAGETRTAVIFVNRLHYQKGSLFESARTTPGSRALKFYSSIRLDLRRVEAIKHGSEEVGSRIKVKVVKNKLAPPFQEAQLDLSFEEVATSARRTSHIRGNDQVAEEPRTRERELRWLEKNIEQVAGKYGGQWIVVEGRKVVSHAQDAASALRRAKEKGIGVPFLLRIPSKNEGPLALQASYV